MTRNARIGFLIAALVVLVGAIVIIGTGGDDSDEQEAAAPTATATAAETDAPTDLQEQAEATTPEPTPTEPPVQTIKVKGGQPVGGVQKVEVDKGDQVQFRVTADAPEEVHLHGYDIAEDVGPGEPAEFDFTADADGIYEVELEHSAVQIAELRVNP